LRYFAETPGQFTENLRRVSPAGANWSGIGQTDKLRQLAITFRDEAFTPLQLR
jgi:hypothetical protein